MDRIDFPLIYSGMTRRALHIAERQHRGVYRKSSGSGYICHPFSAMLVVLPDIADAYHRGQISEQEAINLLCAMVMHDVPEDTSFSLRDITDEFGADVSFLVAGVTKVEFDDEGNKLSSDAKLAQTRTAMLAAHIFIVFIKGADLLVNASDLIFDAKNKGYSEWEVSLKNAARKLPHYIRLGEIIIDRLRSDGFGLILAGVLEERIEQLRSMVEEWGKAEWEAVA